MTDFYVAQARDRQESEYAKFHELANRMAYVSNVAPYLAGDPDILTAVAQLPYPTEQLGSLAASTSAQMDLARTFDYLQRLEPGRQRAVHNMLTPQQQGALAEMGYQEPDSGDDGFSVPGLGIVGKGLGIGLSGLNTVITKTPVVSQVFDLFNTLDNGIKTAYRNISTDEDPWRAGLAAAAAAAGVAFAPVTGGLSLGLTAAAATGAGLLAGNLAAASTNPGDFIETTKRNWNGEAVFGQAAQIEARALVGDRLQVLARDLAWESDPFEIIELFASTPDADEEAAMFHSAERLMDSIRDPGDPARPALMEKLYDVLREPEFVEAIGLLQRSKTSFGRDIARLVGINPGDLGYDTLSGGLDAIFTIVADPTLAMGTVWKWRRASRLGVPILAGEEATVSISAMAKKANEIPSIGRAYDEVARAIDTNQVHLITTRVPHATGLIDGLRNHKLAKLRRGDHSEFTREDIFTFLDETEGKLDMLRGYGLKTGHGKLLLPTYGMSVPGTNLVMATPKAIEGMRAVINFADDAHNRARLVRLARKLEKEHPGTKLPSMSTGKVTGAFNLVDVADEVAWQNVRSFIDFVDKLPVVNRVMRGTGAVMASFTHMMPPTNAISMVGPQAAKDIQRMVGLGRVLGMDSATRAAWFDQIMQQDNIEHRINASLSFLRTILDGAGASATDRGAALVTEFVDKLQHRYSLSVANAGFAMDKSVVNRGIWAHQQTFDLPIPDFKALRELGTKGTISQALFGVTDNKWVDLGINKLWKPAVLLRVGFITRAAGEELLALLVRTGPSQLLAEFGARSIAEGRLYARLTDPDVLSTMKLDVASRRAVERMRYAAHVRPLERMFYNWGDGVNPVSEWLARYSTFLRDGLERGIFPNLKGTTGSVRSLGKEGGLRRSLMIGIDQKTIQRADLWTSTHASSMLKEISSANASIAAELDVRAAEAFVLSQRTRSEFDELGLVVERGKFRTYVRGREGDDQLDRIAHAGMDQLLADEVAGKPLTDTLTRYAPDTIDEADALATLGAMREIQLEPVRRAMIELLNVDDLRTVNWDSFLRHLNENHASRVTAEGMSLADTVAYHFPVAESDPQFVDGVIDVIEDWYGEAYKVNSPFFKETVMPSVEAARRVSARMNTLEGRDRAWMGSFVDHWHRVRDDVTLIRGEDEVRRVLAQVLTDRHHDPELQSLVGSLTYTNRLSNGEFVAKPLLEGTTRIWVPQMEASAYGRLINAMGETQAPDDVVAKLMEMWDEAAPQFDGIHIAQARVGVEQFFNNLVRTPVADIVQHGRNVAQAGKHGTMIPLAHMGFDDPDLVLAMSRFMNAIYGPDQAAQVATRLLTAKGYVGQLDLDDGLKNYLATEIDGAQRPLAMPGLDMRVRTVEPERIDVADVPTELGDPGHTLRATNPKPHKVGPDLLIDGAWADEGSSLVSSLPPDEIEYMLIAGGRDFTDVEAMRAHILAAQQQAAAKGRRLVVVQGGARGADSLAGRVAIELGSHTIQIPADWARVGPGMKQYTVASMGYRRNESMAQGLVKLRDRGYDVSVVLFPGGVGTNHMRNISTNAGLRVFSPAVSPLPTTKNVETLVPAITEPFTLERQTDRVIHGWNLHQRELTDRVVSQADKHLVKLPDGSSQFGIDPAEALAEAVGKQVDDVFWRMGTDTDQQRIVVGEAYADPDGARKLTPGRRLNSTDMAFTKQGERIPFDDQSVFKLVDPIGGGNLHENWTAIGPLLRDSSARIYHTPSTLPDTIPLRGVSPEIQAARAKAAPGPDLVPARTSGAAWAGTRHRKAHFKEYRSHWDQVANLARPPKVAVGPNLVMQRPPTNWERVLEFGFERVISPAIDGIVRRPMAFHFFNEAMEEGTRAGRWLLSPLLFGKGDDPGQLAHQLNYLVDRLPQATERLSDAQLHIRRTVEILRPDIAAAMADVHDADLLSEFFKEMYGQRKILDDINASADLAEAALRTHLAGPNPSGPMKNGVSVAEYQEAINNARALKQMPTWAIGVDGAERPAEAILDVFERLMGEQLKRPFAQVSLNRLPKEMQDGLNEHTWNVIRDASANRAKHYETLAQIASERAIANTIPYLDSHEIRSQGGEYVRGFFPFLYAEENFLKRWARTIAIDPAGLRKMQLAYQGLKSGGVIRTDSQGRDWFVYPGAGLMADVANDAFSRLGLGEVMPSGVVFASETKNMLPGFDVERTGMPSANPLVAVGVGTVAKLFPELRPAQEALVGQAGVAQGGIKQFVPAAARRFWEAMGSEDSSVKYASTMMNVIAILEHNGQGLPPTATRNQMDDYLRRVRNHTRGIMAVQAFVGFIAPGAPSTQFTGKSQLDLSNLTGMHAEIPADIFRDEYLTLVRELGIEEGTIKYFELNPDHDLESLMAFTVGQSYSVSGAPLPATELAVSFADENRGWIEQYPNAAAWMLPQPPPGDEEFDEYAYVQQSISGMRQRRTPEQFMEALKFREGAHDYFIARDLYEAKRDEFEDDPATRRLLADKWKAWKSMHLATHPVFAEQLEGGESRQRRRRVLDEMRVILADPDRPEIAHAKAMGELVEAFDFYKLRLAQMSESRTAEMQDRVEWWKANFDHRIQTFMLLHPELQAFWLTILRPEAGL